MKLPKQNHKDHQIMKSDAFREIEKAANFKKLWFYSFYF